MNNSRNIIPERLTEAREGKGMTKVELAQKLGLSRVSISQYENGISNPSVSSIISMADILEQEINYFYKMPSRLYTVSSPVTFRKLSATAAKSRRIAKVKMVYANDLLENIYNFIEQQPMTVPTENSVANESELLELSDDEIEAIALNVRKKWGVEGRPINNLAFLLENQGIVNFHITLPPLIDAFSYWVNFSETYSFRPITIANSNKNYYRYRFDLAHELGHLILHNKLDESIVEKQHKIVEKQAHRFASSFLMPPMEFSESIKYESLQTLLQLKQHWGVSMAAAMYRMNDLNIIDDQRFTLWNIEFSRKGWNKKEPGDSSKQPEKSFFLNQAIQFAIDEGLSTANEFYNNLNLSFETLAEYTGNLLFQKQPDSEKILQFSPKS